MIGLPVAYLYIRDSTQRTALYLKASKIIEFRDNLLEQMRVKNNERSEFLRARIGTPQFQELLNERSRKDEAAWEVWNAISYELLRESDKPVEEFYTQEVMDILLWNFTTSIETIIKAPSTQVH